MTTVETEVPNLPGLSFALETAPIGFPHVLRDTRDGELRAFAETSGRDDVEYRRMFTDSGSAAGSYVDRRWENPGYRSHSYDVLAGMGDRLWTPYRAQAKSDTPPSWWTARMHYLVGIRSGAVGVILHNLNDGELRGFRSDTPGRHFDWWQCFSSMPDTSWTRRTSPVDYADHLQGGWERVSFDWGLPQSQEFTEPTPVPVTPEQARITELEATLETRNQRIVVLERQVNNQSYTAQAFRDQVREVAIDKAQEHGWCSVIDEILEELGLDPRNKPEYSGRVTITVDFTATHDSYQTEAPDSSDINLDERGLTTAINRYFSISNADSVSVGEINFEIDDIEQE